MMGKRLLTLCLTLTLLVFTSPGCKKQNPKPTQADIEGITLGIFWTLSVCAFAAWSEGAVHGNGIDPFPMSFASGGIMIHGTGYYAEGKSTYDVSFTFWPLFVFPAFHKLATQRVVVEDGDGAIWFFGSCPHPFDFLLEADLDINGKAFHFSYPNVACYASKPNSRFVGDVLVTDEDKSCTKYHFDIPYNESPVK